MVERANSPNRTEDDSGNEYVSEHEVIINPQHEDNYGNLDTNVPRACKEENIEDEEHQEAGPSTQHTPTRVVLLVNHRERTPVKERVGQTETAKRIAQATLPPQERLGTMPSDFPGYPGPSNTRSRRDRPRSNSRKSRRSNPRTAKDRRDHITNLRDKKVPQLEGYMFHNGEYNSSDSEEERMRSHRRDK